jgi:hypothetical protein
MKNPRADKQVSAHTTRRAAYAGGRKTRAVIILAATTLTPERFDALLSPTHKVQSIANYNNARGIGEFN